MEIGKIRLDMAAGSFFSVHWEIVLHGMIDQDGVLLFLFSGDAGQRSTQF